MTSAAGPTYRYVRSFTSIIGAGDLEKVKEIYYSDFLPALDKVSHPHRAEALIEIVDEGAAVVEAILHTEWETLDALHEAMGVDEVGTALMRMLLFNKDRPKVATYAIDGIAG